MHIAVDLRVLDAPGMETTGAGRYVLETTAALQRARPGWRFSLFSNRPELLRPSENTSVLRTRLPTQRALGRIAWLHGVAALPAARLRPDVWFSPSFVLPLWWRGRSIVTIHDLTFLLLPGRYRGKANARYATAATRYSARRADRVLCGAEVTRELLVEHLGIDRAKVAVIPYGVAEAFFADLDPAARSTPGAAAEDSPECPYLLFVGTWEARKGLATLHAALRRVNAEHRRVRLVLAGQPGWGTEALLDALRSDPDVELCEKPEDAHLAELYRGALALVYPSEMEGFGLPVAEAMACGCPVIATELPSIREFAGACPYYLSPGDSARLAEHVESLLDGSAGAESRSERGREVVAPLRWSVLGERTAELIERLPQREDARA
jgi:glycosyltransferase involved in cell wall biosynthesis